MKPPETPFGVSSAAKRLSDTMNLHTAVLSYTEIFAGRFFAFRLYDGHSNGIAYETMEECIKDHANLGMPHGYVRVNPNGMIPIAAESLLKYWRMTYDNGFRPESQGPNIIVPRRFG